MGMTYYYRVGSDSGGWSDVNSFKTAHPVGQAITMPSDDDGDGAKTIPMSFFVFGDLGEWGAASSGPALPGIRYEDGGGDGDGHV